MLKTTFMLFLFLLMFSCSSPTSQDQTTITDIPKDNNNSITEAEKITLGDTISFNLETDEDEDFFKVTVTKSSMLNFDCIEFPQRANDGLVLKLYSSLLDEYGNEIYSSHDSEKFSFNCNVLPGTYIYKITTSGYLQHTISPGLIVLNRDTVDIHEYNDTPLHATPIDLDSIYSAKLIPSSDSDYYRFDLKENCIVTVKVGSITASQKFSLDILNDEEIPVKHYSPDDSLYEGISLESGTYFLKFTSTYGAIPSHKPYTFEIEKYVADSHEWNNSISAAQTIDINSSYKATIFPKNDVDIFAISIPESDTFTVTINDVPDDVRNMYVKILDNNEIEKKSLSNITGESNIIREIYLEKGYYFLHISGYSSSENLFSFSLTN